jgi:hypothetical protein
MKQIYTLIIILMILTPNLHANWFDKKERERRIYAEEQLTAQRRSTLRWQVATGFFAVSAVTLLIIGAAIGSKARRDATKE